MLALCFILTVPAAVSAESPALTLIGEWAFNYNPDNTVIVLNEDGTAAYGGQSLVWEDSETGILLTDAEGASLTLRYELNGAGLVLYLPSFFTRISEIGGEGEIIGTWKSVNEASQSSYVFTEDGKFLEDGYFNGFYTDDPATGHVLLQYSADFEDTDIWYVFTDEGQLCVAYPWRLIRK